LTLSSSWAFSSKKCKFFIQNYI